MMEPRLTSRHAGFYSSQCWCHHSVCLWIYSPLPPDCVPLETRTWMIYAWFLEPSQKDRPRVNAYRMYLFNKWINEHGQWRLSPYLGFQVQQSVSKILDVFHMCHLGMVFPTSLPVPVTAGLGCGSGAHQQVPWRTRCLYWAMKTERGRWWNSCWISFHVKITPSASRIQGGSALDSFLSFFLSV